MLAAVTGGTGFLGSILVTRLAQRGDRVRVLTRPTSDVSALARLPNVELVRGDLADAAALGGLCAGADVLFHMAAVVSWERSSRDAQERVNVEGTRAVMEAARLAGTRRVIYTSSVAAIGLPAKRGVPADETNPFTGAEFGYFRSKHLAERVAFEAVEKHGLDVVALNPGTVFGGGASKRKTGSQKIIGMVAGGIPFYPRGGYCACDVDDVIDAHLAAVEKGRRGERYILGGHNLPLREVFGEIARQLGVRAPWIPVPGPLLRVAGELNELRSRITGRPTTITREYAVLGNMMLAYSSDKAIRELGYRVTPWPETVAKGIRSWREREARESAAAAAREARA
ncbi:MAG TPA: NAD-dependent epimerase/dehydratase family protein [bacterium]|nr:NAD-dependent epimerase/dehydratase family protein [bacterium]